MVLWILLLLAIIFSMLPVRMPTDPSGDFDETRLLVTYQVTTGPDFRVLKGKESLEQAMIIADRKINFAEIELTGSLPTDIINPPYHCESDYEIVGKIIGITDKFEETGSGVIPLFYVSKWRPTKYLVNLFNRKLPRWLDLSIIATVFLGLPLLFLTTLAILIWDFLSRNGVIGDKSKNCISN